MARRNQKPEIHVPAEIYEPSKFQAEFHALPHDEALGAGSAGPGKSECLRMEPMEQIVTEHRRCFGDHEHPLPSGGSTGVALFLRREYTTLRETISRLKVVLKAVDPGCRFYKSDGLFEMSSGYQYLLSHCKDPGDWDRFMSQQFTIILYDEVNQLVEEQYDNINGRLRSSDPVLSKMLKIRAMCNPTPCTDSAAKNPHWVRERFVKPFPSGRKTIREKIVMGDGSVEYYTRIYLPARLTDNPDPAFIKSYEKTLRSRPLHIRKALLEGDWWVSADSFFAEAWQSRLHVIKPFRVPADWPIARAMDWGFKTAGIVGWFAQDPDGNLICIHEFYFRKMSARDVAMAIRDWEKKNGLWDGDVSAISGPADTQLWEERGSSGLTKAQEMAEEGVSWVRADKRSRARNAELVYDRLTDHFDGTTMPGLTFFDTCSHCIEVIPTIGTEKLKPNEPEKSKIDHPYDMVSYMCAYASHNGLDMPYFEEDEPEDKRVRRGSVGFGYGDM